MTRAPLPSREGLRVRAALARALGDMEGGVRARRCPFGLDPVLLNGGATGVCAGPGPVAVVGVGLTMFTVTDGAATLARRPVPPSTPATDPLRPPSMPARPAALPRRLSIIAFCCCLTASIARTCSTACGSRWIVKPMTTGEIGVLGPVCVADGGEPCPGSNV